MALVIHPKFKLIDDSVEFMTIRNITGVPLAYATQTNTYFCVLPPSGYLQADEERDLLIKCNGPLDDNVTEKILLIDYGQTDGSHGKQPRFLQQGQEGTARFSLISPTILVPYLVEQCVTYATEHGYEAGRTNTTILNDFQIEDPSVRGNVTKAMSSIYKCATLDIPFKERIGNLVAKWCSTLRPCSHVANREELVASEASKRVLLVENTMLKEMTATLEEQNLELRKDKERRNLIYAQAVQVIGELEQAVESKAADVIKEQTKYNALEKEFGRIHRENDKIWDLYVTNERNNAKLLSMVSQQHAEVRSAAKQVLDKDIQLRRLTDQLEQERAKSRKDRDNMLGVVGMFNHWRKSIEDDKEMTKDEVEEKGDEAASVCG